MDEAIQEAQQADVFLVEDLNEFVDLINEWHSNAVDTVLHLKNAPPGIEIKVEDEEAFKLEGDVLKGFKLGIELSLNYLGRLPFEAHEDDGSPKH